MRKIEGERKKKQAGERKNKRGGAEEWVCVCTKKKSEKGTPPVHRR
jgi:hypothetical protein